jgi:hypothetical protein
MSGSAHRHQELRHDEGAPPKAKQRAFVQDGPKVDYKGMQAAAARASAARGGKGVVGQSGSEILDYQMPIQNEKDGRSRDSGDCP